MHLFPLVLWSSFLVVGPLVALGYEYRHAVPPRLQVLYGVFLAGILAVFTKYGLQQAASVVAPQGLKGSTLVAANTPR